MWRFTPCILKPKAAEKAVDDPIPSTVLRPVSPILIGPIKDIGKVLIELAANEGKPLNSIGLNAHGRTILSFSVKQLACI
jgi:hypothetical protein